MFFFCAHLTEGMVEAVGAKERIVAKAFITTRRPHGDAVNSALELLNVSIRPGETQRRKEVRTTLIERFSAALNQERLNAVHGGAEIFVGSRPARGINPGLAPKRIDNQTGIVGECRLTARARRGKRFDACIGGESFACFLRLREIEVAGRLCGESVWCEQLADFLELAWVVGGDYHRPGK